MSAGENQIDLQAAQWVACEDRGPLPADQRRQRDAWLAADRRHFGAYARAHAVYARTARARALAGGALATAVVASLPAAAPAPVSMARPRPRRALPRWVGGLAATLMLAALGLHGWGGADSQYATRKGQILRVPLADGSAITLDSASQVRVHYSDKARKVELVRGEALFDVAKDPGRPFVVTAEQTQVTAVGTSFAVSLSERRTNGVEVLVREGIVDVADIQGKVAPTRLAANARALASRAHGIRIEPVPSDDLAQQLAWREGMLAFNGDTLSTAAAQFRRYSDTPIVIDDPAVGSRRIVGLYSASDPLGFASSVALSLGLVVEHKGAAVHLRAPAGVPARATSQMQ